MPRNIFENRRTNLRNLIERWHGPLLLARKLGYSNASFLVQMAGPNPSREVTEKTARKTEEVLGLPAGWLDENPAHNESATKVDMTLVSQVIRTVMQSAEDQGTTLVPAKLGDIVALVYSDSESNGSVIRPEYVKSIIQLVR
jgi:hypothetical protein